MQHPASAPESRFLVLAAHWMRGAPAVWGAAGLVMAAIVALDLAGPPELLDSHRSALFLSLLTLAWAWGLTRIVAHHSTSSLARLPAIAYLHDVLNNRYRPQNPITPENWVIHPADLEGLRKHREALTALPRTSAATVEFRATHGNGEWTWYSASERATRFDRHGALREVLGVAFDISARKRNQQRLGDQVDSLQAILNGSLHPISVRGMDGSYLLKNSAFERLLGDPSKDRAPGGRGALENMLWQTDRVVAGTRRALLTEQILPVPAGDRHYASHTFFIAGAASSSDAVCSVWIDVEDHCLMARGLQARLQMEQSARAEADASVQIKDQYLSLVLHELRTPLNSMVGWLHLLGTAAGSAGEPAERARAALRRAVDQQQDLIRTLSEVAQASHGRLVLQREPLDLKVLVNEAVRKQSSLSQTRGVRIEWDSSAPSCWIDGDGERLGRMVQGLVSMGLKAAVERSILRVTLSQADGQVVLGLQDIAPDGMDSAHGTAYRPFVERNLRTTVRAGGLSPELMLGHQIIALHGGRIELDRNTEGPVLKLAFPARAHPQRPPQALDNGRQIPRLDQMAMLIVDDQGEMREVLKSLLSQQGASVSMAGSATEAMTFFKTERSPALSLAILDIAMPDTDGLALIQQLRQHERRLGWPRMPALALTAHATPELEAEALRAGFDGFLAKPVEPAKLFEVVALMGRTPA